MVDVVLCAATRALGLASSTPHVDVRRVWGGRRPPALLGVSCRAVPLVSRLPHDVRLCGAGHHRMPPACAPGAGSVTRGVEAVGSRGAAAGWALPAGSRAGIGTRDLSAPLSWSLARTERDIPRRSVGRGAPY